MGFLEMQPFIISLLLQRQSVLEFCGFKQQVPSPFLGLGSLQRPNITSLNQRPAILSSKAKIKSLTEIRPGDDSSNKRAITEGILAQTTH